MVKPRETDVARPVVGWLASQHYEVYQEVCIQSHGAVADIVGVSEKLMWLVECKTSLNLALIEQAKAWRQYAHFVSVAVPATWKNRGRGMAVEVLRWLGLGLLEVDGTTVYQRQTPLLNRTARATLLRDRLCEEQKTFAEAGNNQSQYYSPYRDTCRRVVEMVRASPGLTFKELVDGLRHHYNSDLTARSALRGWIDKGAIAGVRLEREDRVLRLYPDGGV